MDRVVTIRFYSIEAVGVGGLDFAAALRRAFQLPLVDRERAVGDGIVLRLEHLEEEGGLLSGDLTRVQTENLPSHPTANATDPLPVDRLGHHAAFCYDTASHIIAIQFDVKMAVGRLNAYASAFAEGKSFGYLPVLNADALERFEEQTPTKLTVRVARVERFADYGAEITDFERGFEAMGALFDAPTVEVTVSQRGRDGGLEKGTVTDTIRRLLGLRERFNGIRAITAHTEEAHDPFNFIKDLMKQSETLDLPPNNPGVARTLRIGFARRCINDQLEYFRGAYAAPAAG